jgi:mono/diheme cytochrome c family protein
MNTARFRNLLLTITILMGVSGCVSPNDGTPTQILNKETLSSPNLASTDISALERGKSMFWAGGCASCHAAPGAKGDALLQLGGGLKLKTRFGTFIVPNISPDKATGVGNWSERDFTNAILDGVAPDGSHYYPSFPYTSYTRMTTWDVTNLWAYLQSLPPVTNKVEDHQIPLLIKSRKAIGVWKKLYFKRGKIVQLENPTHEIARGQYLVEGPGHCGECHTSRNLVGGFDFKNWLAGGPAEEGSGTIPNITPHDDGIGGNSIEDIVASLEPTMAHDGAASAGSSMAYVRENMAKLSLSDRRAIVAYLKAIPAIASKD